MVRGRTKFFVTQLLSLFVLLGSAASAQETTLARLTHESSAELPHTSIDNAWRSPRTPRPGRSAMLPETVISRSAANALFVRSDLDRARTLAAQALRRNPKDAEALFIRMEVAAMEVDAATMLDAAIRLCEAGEASPGDPRVPLAAARIREAAANTQAFRAAVPRIKALLANSELAWLDLHAALLQAAMDGTPGLDPYTVSRAAGILTDWRIVGPLERGTLDLDDSISNAGDLSHAFYQNRAVENFQFPDGRVSLPDYLAHQGTFYAAAHFGSITTATWRVGAEGGSGVEIYVEGRRVLQAAGLGIRSNTFEASPGPHRVQVKFTRAATPLRVTITLPDDETRAPLPKGISAQELAYLLAADHYASGALEEAVRQIDAVPTANTSAALEFLLAQSTKQGTSPSLTAWDKVHALAPAALAADVALAKRAIKDHDGATALRLANHVLSLQPTNAQALEIAASATESSADAIGSEAELWTRRIAAHPSCKTLQNAVAFYRAHGQMAAAESAEQKLDGCAPESLDYAKALSQQGNHAEAADALQQLLTAAPLNRAVRLMLIRELQLAGEDRGAQQAAAEWLHIAPNAERYHRLAAAGSEEEAADEPGDASFYAPYRRDAVAIADDAASSVTTAAAVELLDDHVAISRPDGSVSLYVHSVTRLGVDNAAQPAINLAAPQGAELLTLRVLHADGSATDLPRGARNSLPSLLPGDVVDEEYIVHYAGDGGIPEHPEAFQFVFGSFNERVLNSRFVVLSPAEQADRGVVIATGGVPAITAKVVNGMLQRMWSSDDAEEAESVASAPRNGLPIVRVVEQENGWSVPSSAEHQRRIETIHPGPRPQDS
jgi:tetratricopeptide (TPR) repeat protein